MGGGLVQNCPDAITSCRLYLRCHSFRNRWQAIPFRVEVTTTTTMMMMTIAWKQIMLFYLYIGLRQGSFPGQSQGPVFDASAGAMQRRDGDVGKLLSWLSREKSDESSSFTTSMDVLQRLFLQIEIEANVLAVH